MKTKALSAVRPSENSTAMLKAAAVGFLAFIFGGAKLFGVLSPFSTAFLACLPAAYLPAAGIGAILSILFFSYPGEAIWLLISAATTIGVKLLINRFTHKKVKPAFWGLLAFAAMLLSVFCRSLITRIAPVDLILLGLQTMLCGCFGYFFSIGADTLLQKKVTSAFSYIQSTSLGVLLIAVICATSGYSFWQFNPGVFISVIAIYIAIRRNGVVGGCIMSVLAAAGLALYSADMLAFTALLVISGFLAGAFSPLGKLGQVLTFLTVSVFGTVLMGVPTYMLNHLVEIFVATAVYVILPKKLLNMIDVNTESGSSSIAAHSLQSNVAAKLSFASDTVRDLEQELQSISKRFGDIDFRNHDTVSEIAATTVCKGCSRSLDCWDKCYSDTVDAFIPITSRLRAVGMVDETSVPEYFVDKCCKLTRLIETINDFYSAFLGRQSDRRRVTESRGIVLEQFSSLADMLCEVSHEIGAVSGYDEKLALSVRNAFLKLEPEPLKISCAIDNTGRILIEIYTDNVVSTSQAVLCRAMSNATDCILDLPEITTANNKTRINFFEKAEYEAEYSVQQICRGENTVCGDSVDHFTDHRGYSYFLLSDGMGSGGRAAIDSVMTCSIMAKLLKAGFGTDAALKLINSSLIVKSADESLSTLDLIKLDLYTGKSEFIKAGAAVTLLYQGGEINRISSAALPMGILQPAEAERRLVTMRDGDIILMLSDGAISSGDGYIAELLRSKHARPIREIAVSIAQAAKMKCENGGDDITVIAVRVKKGE